MHVPMRHIGILCVQQYLVHNGAKSLFGVAYFFQKLSEFTIPFSWRAVAMPSHYRIITIV